MKIGIDAKWYYRGNPSGQVVVKNIVDELILQDVSHVLYLFIDKSFVTQARELESQRVIIVPILSRPNLFSNMFLIPYWASKLKLDTVLFQNFISWYPSKTKKIAFIHDVLFLDYPSFFSIPERLYFSPMRWLARKATSIITISNSEKQRLIKHQIGTPNTIDVVYHGINTNYKPLAFYSSARIAAFNQYYQLPNEFILYVGRLNIRKNLLNLVRSLEYINSEIKLIVVGGIDHKHINLVPYIKENDLESRVIFTGHVPDEDLYLFYARSKLFCFPSYAEGFGMPPLEAMRCGIPVVVSDRTSLPEICGVAGTYIDPDNPLDIAKKINLLLQDRVLYNQKCHESLLHSQLFSWTMTANKVINILESKTLS